MKKLPFKIQLGVVRGWYPHEGKWYASDIFKALLFKEDGSFDKFNQLNLDEVRLTKTKRELIQRLKENYEFTKEEII